MVFFLHLTFINKLICAHEFKLRVIESTPNLYVMLTERNNG